MATDIVFSDEDMAIDQGLGYPKAYAKLCRDRSFGPYSNGPPFTFTPYVLVQQEDSRAKELDEMFLIIDPKAKPTTKPKIFVSLLWKQLNHLGNAGFDPEKFRVDPYGNVLYYHADPASPLAWEIDHWFPCSRGGLTVPSNIRILQWQVCKRKHNNLEFLIPWWEFQVGISINQFLSIFASSNSDFRHRAFSWLFSEGETEEINSSQTVDSHAFPQHFIESKEKLGLAPAAVVLSRRESFDAPLKLLDVNRRPRSSTPIIAVKKMKQVPKENEDPLMMSNPYQAIVMARDSLKQREATVKMQAELQKLDNEVYELQRKTEEEKVSIQDLELVLMKRKRRVEKCRRLAETQSSYRAMLEKMIRDTMHQSVVYKEQVRLNQAASSALLARLEAQKAICDSAERELLRKHEQRGELEKQIRPEWEQARKRSRMDDTINEERDDKIVWYLTGQEEPQPQQQKQRNNNTLLEKNVKNILHLPEVKSSSTLHKQLRKFLEEEQRASAASSSLNEEKPQEELEKPKEMINSIRILKPYRDNGKAIVAVENDNITVEGLERLDMSQDKGKTYSVEFPDYCEPEEEEDEESRKLRGKGNIEKWLQFLLEKNSVEDDDFNPPNIDESETTRTNASSNDHRIVSKQTGDDEFNPPNIDESETTRTNALSNDHRIVSKQTGEMPKGIVEMEVRNSMPSNKEIEGMQENHCFNMNNGNNTPFKNPPYRIEPERTKAKELVSAHKAEAKIDDSEDNVRKESNGKERELLRSDSSKRAFRRIPSSPSLILEGMKKRVDCIGKKPLVLDDNDGEEDASAKNSFIKSSIKTIKRAVKF